MRIEDFLKIRSDGAVTLYHGSKGGIDGDITPISRVRCDFGQGFYMGTDKMQAKSLVSNDDMPYIYTLSLDMSKVDPSRILLLESKEWLYAVLANRKNVEQFNALKASKEMLAKCRNADLIIGNIADDKMRQAMNSFTDNAMTDAGLEYCLQYVKYGYQVVAKSQSVCDAVTILEEKPLNGTELSEAIRFSGEIQKKCRNVVDYAKMEFSDNGMRLSDYIKRKRRIEAGFEPADHKAAERSVEHYTKLTQRTSKLG